MKGNLFFVLFVFSTMSHAGEVMNTCWDNIGQNNIYLTFFADRNFNSSKAGATARFSYWSAPSSYNVMCSTNISPIYPNGSVAAQTQTNLLSVGDGYLKLNEDVDIYFSSLQVPTRDRADTARIDFTSSQGIFSDWHNFVYNGDVTLRLRRDQLGGGVHIPSGLFLFSIHASLSSQTDGSRKTEVKNQTPTARVFSTEQYIPLPVVCQINGSTAIEVDFGDIDNTKISRDGSRYVKTVPLQYRCNTPVTQNISINLVAAPAAFSADIIGSSLPEDIGVMVKYNGAQVKPNGKFNTTLVNGRGQDELQVAPVVNDATKSVTGSFTASATLVMTLQ